MNRRIVIYIVALALHAVLMSVAWSVGTKSAKERTEAQLDYAVRNVHDTVAGAIDTMLGHVARTAVRHIGKTHRMSMERMAAGAKELDIDEVNIVDRSGEIIASNDPYCMGAKMAGDPVMDEFMILTNGIAATVSQPFRTHARNPKFRAKYLAAPFPGGDGFVQVGLDERRLAKMMPSILGYIFDEWQLGRTGFFLCADMETGRLISNPSRHRNKAKTLEETGYEFEKAKKYEIISRGKAYGTTFTEKLFGEKCYCRAFLFGGHRFVAALPEREYYDFRNMFGIVFGTLLLVILGAFAFFLDRIFRDSDRLRAFYAAENIRRARDMKIAATIQNSALPLSPPENPYFSINAEMQAATEVGGDFYDYFLLDATHVVFLVADVSGKGVTAALYMMTAKTLIKSTLLAVHDPALALTRVNAELCRNNPANMFLTAWVGILDLETGIVSYANAGHNPPIVLPTCRFVMDKSGPVLAFMNGIEYRKRSLLLAPGDELFLYTDGVTEATDAKGELFGEARLVEALKAARTALKEPISATTVVRAVVTAFAEGMPQADDITVLAIRYIDAPNTSVRSFPPSKEGIAAASAFLDEIAPAPPEEMATWHIILDEICSNIVKHSGASGFDVDIEIVPAPQGVKMIFADDGVPFDPLAHADPDTTLSAELRPIGGLGIMMVKKMATSVSYHRAHNRNYLTVERNSTAKTMKTKTVAS